MNEFSHIMDHHFPIWCLNYICPHKLYAQWERTHMLEMQEMKDGDCESDIERERATELVRTWRKLVFDLKQCIINTNEIPQFVIRLSWLRQHLQKCLIKMIKCQIMTGLFDNEVQIILWHHLFHRTTIDSQCTSQRKERNAKATMFEIFDKTFFLNFVQNYWQKFI